MVLGLNRTHWHGSQWLLAVVICASGGLVRSRARSSTSGPTESRLSWGPCRALGRVARGQVCTSATQTGVCSSSSRTVMPDRNCYLGHHRHIGVTCAITHRYSRTTRQRHACSSIQSSHGAGAAAPLLRDRQARFATRSQAPPRGCNTEASRSLWGPRSRRSRGHGG